MDPLLQTEFAPLAEVKAKLSEKIREIGGGRRLLITSHGRPQAVLISYQDYLVLLQERSDSQSQAVGRIDFQQWKSEKGKRKEVASSILRYFDPTKLPRKGQKEYKRRRVAKFDK